MTTTVRRVDPLTMADQLKRLFVENDRPEFPEWFDRAYPLAVRDGGSSWVAVDSDERVVAHTAGFRATASLRGHDVPGALLCNLMADKGHRTFFPVAATVKRAVKDLAADGAEFIYTNPINSGSVAVMRAAGLPKIGVQNRFLLPLGDLTSLTGLALRARLRLRGRRLGRVEAQPVEVGEAVEWTVSQVSGVSAVTTRRSPDVYFMRHGRLDTGAHRGYLMRSEGGGDVGAAIVATQPESTEAVLVTLRCRTLDVVAPSAAALGVALSRAGLRRLNATALDGTPFALGLIGGGFIERHEPWTIVAAGFTDAGRQVAAGLAHSDLEKIDVD